MKILFYFLIISNLSIFNSLNGERFYYEEAEKFYEYPLKLSVQSHDQYEECGSVFLNYTFFENKEFQVAGQCENTQENWNNYGTWKYGDEQKGWIVKIYLVFPGESQDNSESLIIEEDNNITLHYGVNSEKYTLLNIDEFRQFFLQPEKKENKFAYLQKSAPPNLKDGIRYCIDQENLMLSIATVRNNKVISFDDTIIEEVSEQSKHFLPSENFFQGTFEDKNGLENYFYYNSFALPSMAYNYISKGWGVNNDRYDEVVISHKNYPIKFYSCFEPFKKKPKDAFIINYPPYTSIFLKNSDKSTNVIFYSRKLAYDFIQMYEGWSFTEEERNSYQKEKENNSEERLKVFKTSFNNKLICKDVFFSMERTFIDRTAVIINDLNYVFKSFKACRAVYPGEFVLFKDDIYENGVPLDVGPLKYSGEGFSIRSIDMGYKESG